MSNYKLLALSALSALSGTVLAAPAPQQGTGINDPNYFWQVSTWSAGCSADSGCSYSFNIAGSEYATNNYNIPSFTSYCSGNGEGADLLLCSTIPADTVSVSAHLLAGDMSVPHLEVKMSFTSSGSASYTLTGQVDATYNSYFGGNDVFNIYPYSATGTA